MDSEQFKEFGKAAMDYIVDYMENIREYQVLPSVKPGYMRDLIPSEAPEEPEKWQDLMKDMDRVIMPGMTHWHSPQFHAFFPTASSYPAVVGELLCAGLGCVGFSWLSSPACTELEVEMMNWLGKLLNLPEQFLNCSDGPGGGIIQGSASESTLVGLLAAKERIINRLLAENPDRNENDIKGRLVAYTSEDSNSSVEKAGKLGSVPMRLLPSDEHCRLRGDELEKAIAEDKSKGLIPCYVVATLGTTGTCAFDRIDELGLICEREGMWLHIDAAYAGAAFICPEYRHFMNGIELADSFNFNPHKWMLVNADCSALWVKDSRDLINAFDVQRAYLKDNDCTQTPDYRHWQISLGRRFRAIKLWAVMRLYGASGIRAHIRKHVTLAEHFQILIQQDNRFEIVTEPILGVVCFRIKGSDLYTKTLLSRLMDRKNIFLVSCAYKGSFILRFVVCSRFCETRDVEYAWEEIKSQTTAVLEITNEITTIEKEIQKIDLNEKATPLNQFVIPSNIEEKCK